MRSSREQFGRVCDRFRLWVACYSFRLSSWQQIYSHTQQWGGFYSFIVATWIYFAFARPGWRRRTASLGNNILRKMEGYRGPWREMEEYTLMSDTGHIITTPMRRSVGLCKQNWRSPTSAARSPFLEPALPAERLCC
jgi:hypothetical protein